MAALVIGGGEAVWRDAAVARALVMDTLGVEPINVGVNDAAAEFPGHLHHFATLHPERFPQWLDERRQRRLNTDFQTWTHARRPPSLGAHFPRTLPERGGSSGLFAVDVALHLGLQHIILCGVPMDASKHFRRRAAWRDVDSFRTAWRRAIPSLRGRVRSMGGWTEQELGAPTAEWLKARAGDPPQIAG